MSSGPEFFQTLMGHKFYEGTMPALVKQLQRLNDNLEKMHTKPTPEKTTLPHATARAQPAVTPSVSKIAELSTAHVTERASKLMNALATSGNSIRLWALDGEDSYISVYDRGEYGWFVSVPDVPLERTPYASPEVEELRSLLQVVEYAQKQGWSWLLFDADANIIQDLPQYEW